MRSRVFPDVFVRTYKVDITALHSTSGLSTLFTETELSHILLNLLCPSYPSNTMAAPKVDPIQNLQRMKAGEMYYAFTPDLMADRRRCKQALSRYNKAQDISRREELEMLKEYIYLSFTHALPFPALTQSHIHICQWLVRVLFGG